ncbi:hypothetical protein Tco_0704174 [Tanacetum coccineum]|uniref:Reverse transcriptase domain-containing protein n=1 Tax=Tanacetum coccineum TaxID=301880 RepID=A0ABQ4Y2M1_9ASTR
MYLAKKLLKFSRLVMKDPPGAIIVLISPLGKYLMPLYFLLPTIYKECLRIDQICDSMSKTRQDSHRDEDPQNAIQFVKFLDVGVIDFMDLFRLLRGNKYNLVAAIIFQWVKAEGAPHINDARHANFDLKTAGDHRKLQLNELSELRDQAYENSLIYKEKTKKLHDSKIKNRIFNVGDQVLLFNSRLKIFSVKLNPEHYYGGDTPPLVIPDLQTFPKDN